METKATADQVQSVEQYCAERINNGMRQCVTGWAKADGVIVQECIRSLHNGDPRIACTHPAVKLTVPEWRKAFPYIHKSMFCALLNSGLMKLPTHAEVNVETVENPKCVRLIDDRLEQLGYNPSLSRACKRANAQFTDVDMSIAKAREIIGSLLETDGKGFFHCDYTIGVAVNVLRAAHAPKSLRPVLQRENYAKVGAATKSRPSGLGVKERRVLRDKALYGDDDLYDTVDTQSDDADLIPEFTVDVPVPKQRSGHKVEQK